MIDRKPAESNDTQDEQEILREEQAYQDAQREAGTALDVQNGFGVESFETGLEG